jgi:hypothetical protein
MISVYTLNGTELLLVAGSSFTINWISTVFNDADEFLGSFSYPVNLAYCPSNNKALGMANLLENRSARVDRPVTCRCFGVHWKRCTLSFTLDETGYSAYLKIDNGAFGNILKNKMLAAIFEQDDANGTFTDFIYKNISYSKADTLTYLANSCNTPGKYPAYFFPVKNPSLFGSYSGSANQPYDFGPQTVNPYNPATGWQSTVNDNNTRNNFYTPFFSLTYIVTQVLAYLGYDPDGDFFTDPKILDKVIYNTGFIDTATMFADSGLKLAPARHLPAITLGDFFKRLRTHFKLAIYFDTNTQKCTITFVKSCLQTRDRINLSGYTSPAISIKSDLPTGYDLLQPIDDGDDLFKNFTYNKEFFIGSTDAPKSVDGFIGTLFTQVQNNGLNNDHQYRLPRTAQLGNGYTATANGSDAWNETGYSKNSFGFRLLTYRGMQPDKQGSSYPYATSDEFDSDGTTNTYGMSLWLGGEKGILQLYNFDYYIFFLRAELVQVTAYLPMRLLQQITPLGLMEITSNTQAIIPAMLNDMTFESSLNEKKLLAKMRVYPVYSQRDLDLPAISQFAPGEQINPGDIYAKFVKVIDESKTSIRNHNGVIITTEQYAHYYLYFFSDAAGTKPRVVTNLKVILNMDYKGANPRNYANYNFQVIASGSTYLVGELEVNDLNHIYHYNSGSDFYTRIYTIPTDAKTLASVDYKVIS